MMELAQRKLERGGFDHPISRALASVWAAVADSTLVRPHLSITSKATKLVCVGGATLGGSGKTRVAIAAASFLASHGSTQRSRVAFVGHGYRGRHVASARFVQADDDVEDVGDEAIVCARSLRDANVPVVVGRTRQAAVDLLLSTQRPDVIVFDGPLRIRGCEKETLSLLAVDASAPWGTTERVVPAGDLRASREALLACADRVVKVDATPSFVRVGDTQRHEIRFLEEPLRVGLFTAIARPDRLIRALEAVRIVPRHVISVSDHGSTARALPLHRFELCDVDQWIATEKCALHLQHLRSFKGFRIGILESPLHLDTATKHALRTLIEHH